MSSLFFGTLFCCLKGSQKENFFGGSNKKARIRHPDLKHQALGLLRALGPFCFGVSFPGPGCNSVRSPPKTTQKTKPLLGNGSGLGPALDPKATRRTPCVLRGPSKRQNQTPKSKWSKCLWDKLSPFLCFQVDFRGSH